MLCGRRAFSDAKGSLVQFEAPASFCSKFRTTANKFAIFHTAADNFRVATLPSIERAEHTEAGQWPSLPLPAPYSLFAAASAAPEIAPSAVAAFLGSLSNSKPQLPPAVDGAR